MAEILHHLYELPTSTGDRRIPAINSMVKSRCFKYDYDFQSSF